MTKTRRKPFFLYEAPDPAPLPPFGVAMTQEEWESLTPGYRRAITREFERKPKATPEFDTARLQREHKADVEYAARKRL